MRRVRTCSGVMLAVLGALMLLLTVRAPLGAQVDPRGAMRTLATPHFRVHVRAGDDAMARRAAVIAERAYAQLAQTLAEPAGPIDLLMADNVDFSNGFAQTFPTNRVVIYAAPPIGSTELRFHDDWLELVITHELAHIFHLDRSLGLWRVGRAVFGRNPMFVPNSLTPSWVKEGLAVHYETQLTGSGRLVSTESRTVARTAARDGGLPPIRRWSLATTQFPQGQTAYAYGALLMDRAAQRGGDSSMRRFVDGVAAYPVPFFLDRAARTAFGTAFSRQVREVRDSLQTMVAAMDTSGDALWRAIAPDGWYAESPRWRTRDSLVWVASNGRAVTGLFTADVRRPGVVRREARRNGLDVNAPMAGGDSTVFAQLEYRDAYVVRSDLYVGVGDHERAITHDARLVQPDVRRDGAIVAVQLHAAAAHLVRVARDGRVTPLRTEHTWADPRWSPDGTRLAAVQLLPTGEARIVVMDSVGAVQQIVTGGRAVFASPSFTPDGGRLVWSSDRSGIVQLETAPVARASAEVDTTHWREERAAVRQASRVTTGVYAPTVSPDGSRVAALRYRGDGYVVSVAPLDTNGPMARNTWYPRVNAVRARVATMAMSDTRIVAAIDTTIALSRYRVLRQLAPRYWLPQIGTGRLGQSTFGLSSSASDILERHAWAASVLVDRARGETDASVAWQYRGLAVRGLGVPVLDASWSQAWDATFRASTPTGVLLGTIARRRRFATASSTWRVPRMRRTVSGTLGAQYEQRDFTADVDSLLGAPDALLRRGTRYPNLFASASLSTAARGNRGVSVEEGMTLSASSSYRWREDAPSSTGAWRHSGTVRGYVPLNLPGFARHVLMARVAGAVTGDNSSTELSAGGVSGVSAELIPGVVVGDPSRTFPVRGIAPGAQRGTRALGGSVEYRAPLVLLRDAPGPFTLFADKLALTVFSDAARAWCPGALARRQTGLCERPGTRDGWMASAGAEVVLDLAVQYDAPYRLRIGAAAPYAAPSGVSRRGALYVTLGSAF